MLTPGDQAPDFEMEDAHGQRVRLSDLLRDGPIVLFFYPKDFTPVCTKQACLMRDWHAQLESAGLQVIGVSAGSSRSHQRFESKHHLPYRLLTDPGRRVARQYEAVGLFGLYPKRISYLIDRDGRIRDAVHADFRVTPHRRLLERALEGRGVPASSAA
jgi:peroxiredoxin Q/BCP